MAKKTWQEKFNSDKPHLVKVIEKRFADMPEGTKMFIATPKIIDAYINHIPEGVEVDVQTMRKDLAEEYDAEMTCPVTTSIFLRVVSEVAIEKHQQGTDLDKITPFWRVVKSKSPLAKKLSCGTEFISKLRTNESLS